MKRKLLIVSIVIVFISLIYVITAFSTKQDTSIDLKGENNFWQASINIHLKYDSELIIRPSRDDFKIPSEINVNIFINNKCVYTDKLKYIPSSNKNLLGQYMVTLNSADFFKKNINNIYITIESNNKSSSLLLKQHQETK